VAILLVGIFSFLNRSTEGEVMLYPWFYRMSNNVLNDYLIAQRQARGLAINICFACAMCDV
jgi:hypothetical protein